MPPLEFFEQFAEPIGIGPVLGVDTERDPDVPKIVEWINTPSLTWCSSTVKDDLVYGRLNRRSRGAWSCGGNKVEARDAQEYECDFGP